MEGFLCSMLDIIGLLKNSSQRSLNCGIIIRYFFMRVKAPSCPIKSMGWGPSVVARTTTNRVLDGRRPPTAAFMKKVPSVYTHSMKTIFLSLRVQVAEVTLFKGTVSLF